MQQFQELGRTIPGYRYCFTRDMFLCGFHLSAEGSQVTGYSENVVVTAAAMEFGTVLFISVSMEIPS